MLLPAPTAPGAATPSAPTAETGASFDLLFSELTPGEGEPIPGTKSSAEAEAAVAELLVAAAPRLFDFVPPPEAEAKTVTSGDASPGLAEGSAAEIVPTAAPVAAITGAPDVAARAPRSLPQALGREARSEAVHALKAARDSAGPAEIVILRSGSSPTPPDVAGDEDTSVHAPGTNPDFAPKGPPAHASAWGWRAQFADLSRASFPRSTTGLETPLPRAPESVRADAAVTLSPGETFETGEPGAGRFWQSPLAPMPVTRGAGVGVAIQDSIVAAKQAAASGHPHPADSAGVRRGAEFRFAGQPLESSPVADAAITPVAWPDMPGRFVVDAPRETTGAPAISGLRDPAGPNLEHRGNGAATGEENFAGKRDDRADRQGAQPDGEVKSFLTDKDKGVTSRAAGLGIGGAQLPAHMVAHAHPHVLPNPSPEYAASALASDFSEFAPSSTEALEASSAHLAVEAVLKSVDEVSARAQKTVTLRLSVAGEDLAVRVELRDDQVSTTFTTDSAELRAALSQEWQAVMNTGGERSLRMTPAIFAANDSANAFAGDTASRREQQARKGEEAAGVSFGRGRSRSNGVAARADSALPSAPATSATSLHLSTLA